jgi:hypothetical protein
MVYGYYYYFCQIFVTIIGYEILLERSDNVSYNNNILMETNDTLLCCHGEMHEINIDKKFPIELKTQNLNCEEDSSTSFPSIQSLSKNSSDLMKEGSLLNTSKVLKRKTQHSTTSPWVTVDDSSVSSDIVCGRQMIQFYANPLLDLPEAINVRYIYHIKKIIGINLYFISFF